MFATCITLAMLGGALALKSASLPEWADEARAKAIMVRNYPDRVASDPAMDREYFVQWTKDMDRLRTAKWPLFDLGTGLIASAASLLVGTLLLGIHNAADVVNLKTPPRKTHIFALAGVTWVSLWATGIAALIQAFSRSEFPWWADSIIIPMFSSTVVAVVLAPVVGTAIWFGALRSARLPSSLWMVRLNGVSSLWQVIWLAIVVLGIWLTVLGLRSGPVTLVPTSLYMTYVGLVLRAAAASRFTMQSAQPALSEG